MPVHPTNPPRILLSVPHMGSQENSFVQEAFATNWLSTVGPNINAFEDEMAQYLGAATAALSSGTAAIHLGLRLLGIQPDDEVFCQSLTFVATANPIRYLGAVPVFIDSETATWNMDPQALSDALQERVRRHRKLPRAVVVVDLFGQCADMDAIMEVCGRYEIPVLEDAAEALGGTYKGRPAGTLSEIAAISFNGNKIITTTGGGMLVSRNHAWIEQARFWAAQARDEGLAYHHSDIGYNYRISNVLAGIGRGQIRVLDQRVRQRRGIATRYQNALGDLPGITLMPQSPFGLHTNWLSCFLIEQDTFGCTRDQLIWSLRQVGIESRPVWTPMHLQPLFADCEVYGGAVAEDLGRRGICLPSSSSLSIDDQLFVANHIRTSVGANTLGEFPPEVVVVKPVEQEQPMEYLAAS